MLERFDFDTYGRLLDALKAGRPNLTFREFQSGHSPDRYFILRHDVDISPAAALRMAEWEAARGFRATYFVLLTSDWYNLLDRRHVGFPRRLVELGHEVGLHYDAAIFQGERSLRLQADLLGLLSGEPVHSIARHNPSAEGADPFLSAKDFVNAYDEAFTRRAVYVSDSAGAWRDEAVRILSSSTLPDRIQVLTHPLYWDVRHADRLERLRALVEERARGDQAAEEVLAALWARHPGALQAAARNQEGRSGPG